MQIKKFLMLKIVISLAIVILIISCNGPGSGPLQRESFKKENMSNQAEGQEHQAQINTEKIDVVIEPCDGCITVASLLENKKTYSGKVIKIKGTVTKYNPEILGKNWVHIQDGSEYKDGFDLTVTTDIQTSVGEVITFEGKIVLDKDFGYGYFYNVLMEDGKPVL
jgi:hypothetical protein